MTLRLRIDKHRCIGAETCIQLAPTAFGWDPEELGKAVLVDPSTVEDEMLLEAEAACPTGAIIIDEAEE
ncbi:MAG: ferredoxin [Actinomycetota bacterium]